MADIYAQITAKCEYEKYRKLTPSLTKLIKDQYQIYSTKQNNIKKNDIKQL